MQKSGFLMMGLIICPFIIQAMSLSSYPKENASPSSSSQVVLDLFVVITCSLNIVSVCHYFYFFPTVMCQDKQDQRTNGPVNAHLSLLHIPINMFEYYGI